MESCLVIDNTHSWNFANGGFGMSMDVHGMSKFTFCIKVPYQDMIMDKWVHMFVLNATAYFNIAFSLFL